LQAKLSTDSPAPDPLDVQTVLVKHLAGQVGMVGLVLGELGRERRAGMGHLTGGQNGALTPDALEGGRASAIMGDQHLKPLILGQVVQTLGHEAGHVAHQQKALASGYGGVLARQGFSMLGGRAGAGGLDLGLPGVEPRLRPVERLIGLGELGRAAEGSLATELGPQPSRNIEARMPGLALAHGERVAG